MPCPAETGFLLPAPASAQAARRFAAGKTFVGIFMAPLAGAHLQRFPRHPQTLKDIVSARTSTDGDTALNPAAHILSKEKNHNDCHPVHWPDRSAPLVGSPDLLPTEDPLMIRNTKFGAVLLIAPACVAGVYMVARALALIEEGQWDVLSAGVLGLSLLVFLATRDMWKS